MTATITPPEARGPAGAPGDINTGDPTEGLPVDHLNTTEFDLAVNDAIADGSPETPAEPGAPEASSSPEGRHMRRFAKRVGKIVVGAARRAETFAYDTKEESAPYDPSDPTSQNWAGLSNVNRMTVDERTSPLSRVETDEHSYSGREVSRQHQEALDHVEIRRRNVGRRLARFAVRHSRSEHGIVSGPSSLASNVMIRGNDNLRTSINHDVDVEERTHATHEKVKKNKKLSERQLRGRRNSTPPARPRTPEARSTTEAAATTPAAEAATVPAATEAARPNAETLNFDSTLNITPGIKPFVDRYLSDGWSTELRAALGDTGEELARLYALPEIERNQPSNHRRMAELTEAAQALEQSFEREAVLDSLCQTYNVRQRLEGLVNIHNTRDEASAEGNRYTQAYSEAILAGSDKKLAGLGGLVSEYGNIEEQYALDAQGAYEAAVRRHGERSLEATRAKIDLDHPNQAEIDSLKKKLEADYITMMLKDKVAKVKALISTENTALYSGVLEGEDKEAHQKIADRYKKQLHVLEEFLGVIEDGKSAYPERRDEAIRQAIVKPAPVTPPAPERGTPVEAHRSTTTATRSRTTPVPPVPERGRGGRRRRTTARR